MEVYKYSLCKPFVQLTMHQRILLQNSVWVRAQRFWAYSHGTPRQRKCFILCKSQRDSKGVWHIWYPLFGSDRPLLMAINNQLRATGSQLLSTNITEDRLTIYS